MEIRYSRGGLLGWIQERWFEFRQGHGTYARAGGAGFIGSHLVDHLMARGETLKTISTQE